MEERLLERARQRKDKDREREERVWETKNLSASKRDVKMKWKIIVVSSVHRKITFTSFERQFDLVSSSTTRVNCFLFITFNFL